MADIGRILRILLDRLALVGHVVAPPVLRMALAVPFFRSGLTRWDGFLSLITLPVLLVLGFATRFAALALLLMTGVIQLVVPDGWPTFHLPWAAMAFAIIALGAGPLSFDRLIFEHIWPRLSASAR
jgi:putative oxidoreductase